MNCIENDNKFNIETVLINWEPKSEESISSEYQSECRGACQSIENNCSEQSTTCDTKCGAAYNSQTADSCEHLYQPRIQLELRKELKL